MAPTPHNATVKAQSGTSLALSTPTRTGGGAAQVDDTLLAFVMVTGNQTVNSVPGGFAEINVALLSNHRVYSYRRTVATSEPTSHTWGVTGTGVPLAGIMVLVSGAHPTLPVNVSGADVQSTTSVNCVAPSVTTTLDDCLIVTGHLWAGADLVDASTATPPSGMTESAEVNTTTLSSTKRLLEAAYVPQTTAGATGTKTATASHSVSIKVAHTIALSATATSQASVTHRRVGAVLPSGFSAVGKFSGATSVRLIASTTSDLATSPVYSASVAPDAQGMVKASVSGLSPNTTYYYGWEESGAIIASGRGQCKTLQSGAHSFAFAVASCSVSGSNAAVFSAIRNRNPAFFLMTGDMHYENISSTDANLYRTAYNNVLANANQQTLYANIPTAYVYDDHDFAGGNDANSTSIGADVVPQVYRQYMPHYPLEQATTSEGVYHSFEVGRVRFIVLDTRRYRSPDADADTSSKTMLGTAQKTWLKNLLSANKTQLKFLVSPAAWTPNSTTGDNWGSYQTERTELVNFISTNNVKNIVVLAGDSHLVASDDGRNSPASLPVLQAAPLDQPSNHTGLATYQFGPVPATDGVAAQQYGWVTVTDAGGPTVAVTLNGHDQNNTALLTEQNLSFGVSAGAPYSCGMLGV